MMTGKVVPGVVPVSTCPHCAAPLQCCSQGRQRGATGHREPAEGEEGGDAPVSRLAEEDELLGALEAAIVTPDPGGVRRDVTERGDGPGAAVRAHAVVGLGQQRERRLGVHETTF